VIEARLYADYLAHEAERVPKSFLFAKIWAKPGAAESSNHFSRLLTTYSAPANNQKTRVWFYKMYFVYFCTPCFGKSVNFTRVVGA
jgi:hypothetical protein